VAKLGGYHSKCYEPGTGTPVTNYGLNNDGWGYIEGTWYSGTSNYLPRLHMGLENVAQGIVHVQSVSVREDLGGGRLGPEMMVKPSMEHHLYIPDEKAYAFDKIVANAERNGVYLKLVVMEKEDKIYKKMADDGSWATSDNANGFLWHRPYGEQDPLAAASVVALSTGALGLFDQHSFLGAHERRQSVADQTLSTRRRVRKIHALPGLWCRARAR
jgi:hypothetical protein